MAIGDETLYEWDTYQRGDLTLHVIKAEDTIKDRLAHAIHNGDPSATKQAAEVARLHPVNLEAIQRWCETEGGRAVYGHFEALLAT